MDVCYLINQLAPGGAPTLLLDIVKGTETSDFSFTVAFIEGDDTLISDFQDAGVRVVRFDAEFKFDPRAMWRLYRFFQRESFDIVHTHLPYAQTVGRIMTTLGHQGAVISTQHNFPSHYHPITRITERLTRPLDDMTIGVSKAVTTAFDGTNSTNWTTIYNGADIDAIRAAINRADGSSVREELGIPPTDHIFLCVSRYVRQKRQATLIQAFKKARISDAHLVLVGWGPQESALRQLAHDFGISDRVIVTGQVSTVWPYLAAADTFTSATTIESFGIVYLEAMAAGLPIVATNVRGAKEVLNKSSRGVVFVPPGNMDSFAKAFQKVYTDPPHTAHAPALSRFDIENTVDEHLRLYKQLL